MKLIKRLKKKLLLIREKLANKHKKVVLGRVACLGKELFRMHPDGEWTNVLVNQQKMRVDLFADLITGAPRCRPELTRMHLARHDIYPFLEEQAKIPWLHQSAVKYMLMDSFSELTDQLFVHKKEGWAFCCHYSDIEHSPEFDAEFECRGLLDVELFEPSYRAFFEWFESTHPNTQVIFLHFPTALDPREVFKERAKEIARVIEKIAKEKTYIYTMSVDESEVTPAAGDTFPYHFGRETNMAFLRKWNLPNEY